MGNTTAITWTHATFNPWIGCTKVSPGCVHCYAKERYGDRFGIEWGPTGVRKRTSESNWREPLKLNRKAEKEGRQKRMFCASLADVFEDNPQLVDMRSDLIDLIVKCPWLVWLLLTKRIENVKAQLELAYGEDWEEFFNEHPNVWIGFTGEDQEWFDKRWAIAKHIPAEVIFVSIEPMLGPVVLPEDLLKRGRNVWIIVGGESGNGARPFEAKWAWDLRNQCVAWGVPFFFKQYGDNSPDGNPALHHGGDILDGRQWHEFPDGELA